MALKDEAVARTVDAKGQVCPYPIIAARAQLKTMTPGEVMEFITDNPATANETMPALLQSRNYPYEREELAPGVWRFFVKKTS